jgi:hypothetical protein
MQSPIVFLRPCVNPAGIGMVGRYNISYIPSMPFLPSAACLPACCPVSCDPCPRNNTHFLRDKSYGANKTQQAANMDVRPEWAVEAF